jgi:hypothetical protein
VATIAAGLSGLHCELLKLPEGPREFRKQKSVEPVVKSDSVVRSRSDKARPRSAFVILNPIHGVVDYSRENVGVALDSPYLHEFKWMD